MPTFFVNPQDLINVEITGKLEVYAAGDDDYIGFVVGYKGPISTGTDYDYMTFFWAGNYLDGTTTHPNHSCYFREVIGTTNIDLQQTTLTQGGQEIPFIILHVYIPLLELL